MLEWPDLRGSSWTLINQISTKEHDYTTRAESVGDSVPLAENHQHAMEKLNVQQKMFMQATLCQLSHCMLPGMIHRENQADKLHVDIHGVVNIRI